jgi:hypothetical protein
MVLIVALDRGLMRHTSASESDLFLGKEPSALQPESDHQGWFWDGGGPRVENDEDLSEEDAARQNRILQLAQQQERDGSVSELCAGLNTDTGWLWKRLVRVYRVRVYAGWNQGLRSDSDWPSPTSRRTGGGLPSSWSRLR